MFALLASQVEAKTIHWLTFIDTTDPYVGDIDKNTHSILYSHWIDLVNATLKDNGYSVNVIDVYGNETSGAKCTNTVRNLHCEKDDIVMFYYVGHGTENTGVSKYPLLCMAEHDINKFVPFSWVHETLRGHGARLTISIAMCCNARQGVPGMASPGFGANYGATYVDESMARAIKTMFLNYTGDLMVASASPAESSYPCNSGLGLTDFFTLSLLKQFNVVLPENSSSDWQSMLTDIRTEVKNNVMQSRGESQTAMWTNNLTSGSTPTKTTPKKPTRKVEKKGDNSDIKSKLNEILTFISSENADDDDRENMAKNLESVCSKKLIVRMMPQDGDVPVDKEPISVFLGRISTSSLIKNVSVVDFEMNQNGEISSLKVREVYKNKKVNFKF
jgi:hypothetical protein